MSTYELEVPTLQQLVRRAQSDMEAELGTEAALLRKTPERVFATVAAGLAFGTYGKQISTARNIVPSADNNPEALEKHALLWLGDEDGKKPAAPAQLPISGTGVADTPIPANRRWRRDPDGVLYENQDASVFSAATPVIVQSIALEGEPGFGADGNTVAGQTLTLVTPVVGLDAEWTVDGDPLDPAVGGGADEETQEALAARVENRAQNPPRGGAIGDYVSWALEVPGVGQAFEVVGLSGAGTITVFIVRADIDSPLPDAVLLAEVQEHLDEEAPLGVTVFVLAPTLLDLNPKIQIQPFTTAVEDAITASLVDIISRRAVPGEIFRRSHITEAISLAIGEFDHTLTVPAADVVTTSTQLLVIGTPDYTEKVD